MEYTNLQSYKVYKNTKLKYTKIIQPGRSQGYLESYTYFYQLSIIVIFFLVLLN
mgnify:CR=1 FL=1